MCVYEGARKIDMSAFRYLQNKSNLIVVSPYQ